MQTCALAGGGCRYVHEMVLADAWPQFAPWFYVPPPDADSDADVAKPADDAVGFSVGDAVGDAEDGPVTAAQLEAISSEVRPPFSGE